MPTSIRTIAAVLTLAACGMVSLPSNAGAQNPDSSSANTPGFVKNAKDLGPVDPSTLITVTAWLKLHNEGQLDQLVKQQYTKGHPNFHLWITQYQFNAQFAPTANEAKAVQSWLNAHNLTTVEVEENNL